MIEAQLSGGAGCPSPSHPSRRAFVKTLGTAALAATIPVPRIGGHRAEGATEETAVVRFYRSLNGEQRKLLCLPCDDPRRSRVENNWAVVRPTIGDLSPGQRSLCREIFQDLCGEEGYKRFQRQMTDDDGGFERYHVAVFGTPEVGQSFEWIVTGRHLTLRADGHRAGVVGRGGPIFYGHSAESDNVWSSQGQQATALFHTFDAAQRARALVDLSNPAAPRATGVSIALLDPRQKSMVRQWFCDLTRPFRAFDHDGVRECLHEPDGADSLRLTFFHEGHRGGSQAGDVWKLEGPGFTWSFHGVPHVHAWFTVS